MADGQPMRFGYDAVTASYGAADGQGPDTLVHSSGGPWTLVDSSGNQYEFTTAAARSSSTAKTPRG